MSGASGSMGGIWEPLIFYNSYDEKDIPAGVRKLTLDEFESEFSEEEKEREISNIYVCSSKLEDLPWFSNKDTRHYYIYLTGAENREWVIEKTQTGILIQYSQHYQLHKFFKGELTSMEKEDALGNKRIETDLVKDTECLCEAAKGKTIGTVINWLRNTHQLEKRYNVLEENCIHFARDLFNLICEREMKELKEILVSFRANINTFGATALATTLLTAIISRRNN